jgi:hypothetical protein
MMSESVAMKCHCGEEYKARQADLDRGWARSCSKSCAAIRRDFGRNAAVRLDGKKIKKTKPKPSTARKWTPEQLQAHIDHLNDSAMDDAELGWDGHKGAF